MKYSEAIKLLEENPNNVVMAQCAVMGGWIVRMSVVRGISRYFHFEVLDGGKVIDESSCAGGFNGNVALDLDWQLVRQPVTWQEAIQAWVDGKKVVWEEDAERRVFDRSNGWLSPMNQVHLIDQDGNALTVGMILRGKWYVED